MDEYIERKAAIQSAKHAWAKGLEPSQYIEIIPSADVDDVVRCRDCIGRSTWYNDAKYGCAVCGMSGMYPKSEDSYCSYGERKDGGGMDEYIKRDDAITTVLYTYFNTPKMNLKGRLFLNAILDLQPADVVPARHGSIIETIEDGHMKRVFSCCGTDFTEMTRWMTTNFCPECGAKMDGERREENK